MRFAQILAENWYALDAVTPPRPKAADTPLRDSDAGDCTRKLWYDLKGYEPERFDEAGVWVTNIGKLIHEHWQAALIARFPGAVAEHKVAGLLTSGHLDLHLPEEDWLITLELKTVNGTGFRRAVGAPSGFTRKGASPPEPKGPRHGDIRQLALNAHLAGADEARLCYVAMEAVSKGKEDMGFDGYDRFCAEWSWTADEFNPIALDELARFRRVIESTRWPLPPAPEFEGKLISPPGEAVFPCRYCAHQRQCLKDSAP